MFKPTTTTVPTERHRVSLSGTALAALDEIHRRRNAVLDRLNSARAAAFHNHELPFDITVQSLGDTPWLPDGCTEQLNWTNAYDWRNAYNDVVFRDTAWEDAPRDTFSSLSTWDFQFRTRAVQQDGKVLYLPFEGSSVRIETATTPMLDQYDYLNIEIQLGHEERTRRTYVSLTQVDPIQRTYESPHEVFSNSSGYVQAIRNTDENTTLHAVNAAIEDSGLGNVTRVALARYLAQETNTVRLPADTSGRLLYEIATALAPHVAHIPQQGDIIMSRTPLPDAFDVWNERFPRKQHLTTDEKEHLYATLFNDAVGTKFGGATDPFLRGRGLVATMYDEGELDDTDVENYALCPWQPWSRESVLEAVAVGERTRRALEQTGAERGVTFPSNVFKWLDKTGIPVHWSLT